MTDSEKPAVDVGAAAGSATPHGAEAQPVPGAGSTAAGPPKTEEQPIKFGGYQIVPTQREMPETGFVADPEALARAMAALSGAAQKSTGVPSDGKARSPLAPLGPIQKLTKSKTGVYGAVSVVMGLLAGLIVAVLVLHPKIPSAAADMGPVNAIQYGLMGHLTVNWKDKLEYQVTIEPSDASAAAAFAANVYSSPKPLSIDLQAKDPFGAVLCSDTVLLRFDPRNAQGGAVADAGSNPPHVQKGLADRNQLTRELTIARLEAQELEREKGKSVFHNDTGKDGQLTSISAEGVLPCTKQQFEKFAAWGFTSTFPIVNAPQKNAAGDSDEQREETAESRRGSASANAAAKNQAKRKQAPMLPPIYVEGDDAIVWVDAANGAIETRGGKVLLMDKADALASPLKGWDYPIPIHYRCDQEGNCTFAGVGTGTHHARLRR